MTDQERIELFEHQIAQLQEQLEYLIMLEYSVITVVVIGFIVAIYHVWGKE